MTIKQLKNAIAGLDDSAEFVVSSDEELNTIFGKWEVTELKGEKKPTYCIYSFNKSKIQLKKEEE